MRHENEDLTGEVDRRIFLTAGTTALAAAGVFGTAAAAAQPAQQTTQAAVLPTRTLGRSGIDVTILNLGTWMSPGGDRLLRLAWAKGIRYFDTAKSYGSEPMIARWMAGMPAGTRKNLFLATKDQPNTPAQLIDQLDQRLESLQTDYVDLMFLHALGDRNFDLELEWVRGQELKQVADAIRKSGKAKLVGFSSHHPQRHLLMQSAAQGGFIDVIMIQNNPWMAADDNMNRAIDLCAEELKISITEYTVAGVDYENLFAHHWYIGTNDEVDTEKLRTIIDEHLKTLNDDYRVERLAALKEVIVDVLPPDVFLQWMRRNGKEGGQNKFPRVLKNDRLENWKTHVAQFRKEPAPH